MPTVNVHQTKTQLSRLLALAEDGEEVSSFAKNPYFALFSNMCQTESPMIINRTASTR